MKQQKNGLAKWGLIAKWVTIIIIIVSNIFLLAYNTGVTHNDVKHLKQDVAELKEDVKELRTYIIERF